MPFVTLPAFVSFLIYRLFLDSDLGRLSAPRKGPIWGRDPQGRGALRALPWDMGPMRRTDALELPLVNAGRL